MQINTLSQVFITYVPRQQLQEQLQKQQSAGAVNYIRNNKIINKLNT
jgi:hypothetical protein